MAMGKMYNATIGKKNTRSIVRRRYRRRRAIKDRVYRKEPRRIPDSIFVNNMPDRFFIKAGYEERILFTSTAGIQSAYVFRGNSAYDPNQTGTGSQIQYFDQLVAMYTNYRIRGCKITGRFVTSGTTAGSQTFDIVIYPSLTTTPVNQDSSHVQPMAVSRVGNLGSNTMVLKSYVSTVKMFGTKKDSISNNDAYGATSSTNPINTWFFVVTVQSADQSTTGSAIGYINLQYYVEFYNRVSLNLS